MEETGGERLTVNRCITETVTALNVEIYLYSLVCLGIMFTVKYYDFSVFYSLCVVEAADLLLILLLLIFLIYIFLNVIVVRTGVLKTSIKV